VTRLDIQDVVVRFGGVTAVNSASITADGGDVTALIGPNGAGKTTLFNVITGLQKPTDGHVFLDGNDITSMPTHQRARHGIARTFQRLEAFGSLTVAENIRVAADAAASQRRPGVAKTNPAAVTNGLIAKIGLERYANAQADSVPTGTARLLELARALAIDPDLLLLDEPSSGLSETETEVFGDLLRELAGQGRAVLIVEHDMPLIMRISDRIHVLDRGTLIASGTPAEIQADPVVRKAYLGEEEGTGPAEAAEAPEIIRLAVPQERRIEKTLVMPQVRTESAGAEPVMAVPAGPQPVDDDSIHKWLAPEEPAEFTPLPPPLYRGAPKPPLPTAQELLDGIVAPGPAAAEAGPSLPTAHELLSESFAPGPAPTGAPPPLPSGPGPDAAEEGWF
jgi:branched-chain amino acid transport system ATP-binding protein